MDIPYILSKIRPGQILCRNAYTYDMMLQFWEGDISEIPTLEEISNYWNNYGKKELENLKISFDREKSYPKIGDQLDAILKYFQAGGISGNENGTDLEKVIYQWRDVKNKNPKKV